MDWDRLEEGWVGMGHSCTLQALPVPPGATCLWLGPPLRPSSLLLLCSLSEQPWLMAAHSLLRRIKFPTQ